MCKAISLTFSKKNEDVYQKIMNRDKTKYKTSTEYICAAIRGFGEIQETSSENLTKYDVEYIINSALSNFKVELMNSNLSFNNPIQVEEKTLESLEENLDSDFLNIDED